MLIHMSFQWQKKTYLLLLFLIAVLTGCSFLSPVKTTPEKTYVLTSLPCPIVKYPSRHITLLVPQPESNPIFNTPLMAYTVCPYQVAYFARNSWAATPAEMLHPLIIQTLQNAHFFHAVCSSSTVNSDYILRTQLLELLHDFSCEPSVVILKMRAQIINAANNQVIATRQFCVREIAPCRAPYGGVIAANCATAKVLGQLAHFCLYPSG